MNLTQTPTQTPQITLEQYIAGEFDSPWSDCLWSDGELVEVPPETGKNCAIAAYLFFEFKLYVRLHQLGWGVYHKDAEIEVNSPKHRTRRPDVTILSAALNQQLLDQSLVIRQTMAPPLLVVEVLSPGNRSTDLREKVQEYGNRAIPEYWTVDWDRPTPHVIVRTFQANRSSQGYAVQKFEPGQMVQSGILQGLQLNVTDILAAE